MLMFVCCLSHVGLLEGTAAPRILTALALDYSLKTGIIRRCLPDVAQQHNQFQLQTYSPGSTAMAFALVQSRKLHM